MTPEEELYVKKLEADLSKFQALYEGTKERNDIIFYKGEKQGQEFTTIVEVITTDAGPTEEKTIENYISGDSVMGFKYLLSQMGHQVEVKSLPEELIPDVKTKIYKLEDKYPKLYKLLWIVIQPWRSATCVYDIILAVIANLFILALLSSPVLLFL